MEFLIIMNSFKSSAELKGMAKEQLFGNYGNAVGATVVTGLIMMVMFFILEIFSAFTIGGSVSVPQLIIYFLISFIVSLFNGLLTSGKAFFYLKITCGQPAAISDIFYGFRVYPDKALIIQFFLSLFTFVCELPMIIFYLLYMFHPENVVYLLLMSICSVAGSIATIIVSLIFSQSFYLLQDFPQYSAKELLNMSLQIMKGHKGRLFYIVVSFIPLYILGTFSCCIAFLWIVPYTNTIMANFYMDLMRGRSGQN